MAPKEEGVGASSASTIDLNLLPPERRRSAGPGLRARLAVVALSLLVIALMAYLVLLTREVGRLRARLQDLRAEASALQEEAPGLEARRAELARLESWRRGQEEEAGPWARLLETLRPGEEGVQVHSLSIEGARLELIGTSRDRQALDAYLARLQGSPLLAAVSLTREPQQAGEGGSLQFSLQAALSGGLP